jgi:hypothetical protein
LADSKEKNFMHYIEALQTYNGKETSLFLAGGITGCPDWQQEIVAALRHTNLVVLNPRRSHFLPHENAAQEQITWEHIHLRQATAISFWFPKETLCPIVLYELGAWSMTNKQIFVGVHPDYQRIATSIEQLTQEIVSWVKLDSHIPSS